jgi:hypothetical protein
MNKHPQFVSLMEWNGISVRTLWRRLQETAPDLGKHVTIEYKAPLTAEVKEDRCDASSRWVWGAWQELVSVLCRMCVMATTAIQLLNCACS